MKEIILEKRYPHSRDEDITDAFMRGYEIGKEQVDKDKNVRSKDCETCKHNKLEWFSEVCDGCSKAHSNYEPKDEPPMDSLKTVRELQEYFDIKREPTLSEMCKNEPQSNILLDAMAKAFGIEDEPQTDLLVKAPRKSRESHEKETEPQTDCAWKKGE